MMIVTKRSPPHPIPSTIHSPEALFRPVGTNQPPLPIRAMDMDQPDISTSSTTSILHVTCSVTHLHFTHDPQPPPKQHITPHPIRSMSYAVIHDQKKQDSEKRENHFYLRVDGLIHPPDSLPRSVSSHVGR